MMNDDYTKLDDVDDVVSRQLTNAEKLDHLSILSPTNEDELKTKTTELSIPYQTYMMIQRYIEKNKLQENREDVINKIILAGINQLSHKETSSSLFLQGKKVRDDEALKLTQIIKLLHSEETYPIFKTGRLKTIINKVMGGAVDRTKTRYLNTVTSNSIPNKVNGTYDVTQLETSIPDSYFEMIGKLS